MSKVKVGVAWRRDGRNTAHAGDLAVFEHADLTADVDVYSLAWANAPTAEGLRPGHLAEMDLLVIPGGPHANDTQITEIGKSARNAPRATDEPYAKARATSELDLIEQARTLGMPILALCGGSWRLVENYGGETVELAALGRSGELLQSGRIDENRTRHAGDMRKVETEFKHGANVTSGSMLQSALAPKLAEKPKRIARDAKNRVPATRPNGPDKMNVNSVHWAAFRTSTMGTRPDVPARPYTVVPNNMLIVSAEDDSKLGTPEAVESQHGAPVFGVQWHPEYQLPVEGGQNPMARAANLRLIQWMVKAGRAYRAHKETMKQLLEKHDDKSAEKNSSLGEVTFAGANRVHTGDPGRGPGAETIGRHADDTATGKMSMSEQAVRKYLFGLGRKTKLFLTIPELSNLAVGAPLSRFQEPGQEPDGVTKKLILDLLKDHEEYQKYLDPQTTQTIDRW